MAILITIYKDEDCDPVSKPVVSASKTVSPTANNGNNGNRDSRSRSSSRPPSANHQHA